MSGRPGEFPTVSRCARDYAKATGSRCSCRRRWSTSTWSSGCSRRASYRSPWTPGSRRSSASGSWPASPPRCWSRRSSSSSELRRGLPRPPRAAPRPADALHERHHRDAEGRVERAALRRRRRRAGGRGAVALGLRRQRREPGAARRSTTRRRCGSRWARRWPAAGSSCPARSTRPLVTEAIERRAADVHVLRADAPAAAVRALGRGRHAGPVVVPARRARRGAVPGRGEAAAGRGLPRAARPGSSTARPRASSRPAAPRSGSARPGTVGRARPGRVLSTRRRRHDLVRGAAVRPVRLLRRPRQDGRRVAGHRRRAGVHRRRPRPARRRRLPVPRRPPRGPGHQRRRQRLSARGRAGRSSSTRASTTSPCTASPTSSGASACVRRTSAPRLPSELDAFVRERLAPPKRPKTWHPLPDLPRTLTGKVLRQELPR